MRIDAHQHFWNYDPVKDAWIDDTMQTIKRGFLPQDLKLILDDNDLDGCVAVQASQSEGETRFLLDLVGQHSFIKGVVGWVDLMAENVNDRLVHFGKNPTFKGVRHVAQGEADDFLMRKDVQRGIGFLSQHNLTYDILIFERQLPAAIELVKAFPNQPFVLDHIAKPLIKDQVISPWDARIRELAQCENVMCKVSGMVTEASWDAWKIQDFTPYLDVVFDSFGPERIMFGSDWPVCLLGGDYSRVKSILSDYIEGFSENEKAAIWGENATRFYNL